MSSLDRHKLESEVQSRAAHYLRQEWLEVDFYRIRQRLAFPLPLAQLPCPEVVVRGIAYYPWETWVLWNLEERLLTLGWHADWSGEEEARDALLRELEVLAGWSFFRSAKGSFLAAAHVVRIFVTSLGWSFVPEDLAAKVRAALVRLIDEHLSLIAEHYEKIATSRDVLDADDKRWYLGNIPLIGLCALTTAAVASGHPKIGWLRERLEAVVEAWTLLRAHGLTEGVAYDGYILDFLWDSPLATDPGSFQAVSADLLQCALALGAPGNPLEIVELSDVEPVEMRFYLSAIAKADAVCRQAGADWLFSGIQPSELRVDTLAALYRSCGEPVASEEPPAPEGVLDARYSLVLRRGWKADEPAVAMGYSRWLAGHLHHDTGSVCIGRKGHWLITDAGYQQYMPTSERAFSLGKWAHNALVIGGYPQARKLSWKGENVTSGRNADGSLGVIFHLADCYPPEAGVLHYRRSILLQVDGSVEVRDEIEADRLVSYCWLGTIGAAWMVEGEGISVCLPGNRLRVSLEGEALGWEDIVRPPGSRGSQALYLERKIGGRGVFVWRFQWA